jgi:four helix bundle protein
VELAAQHAAEAAGRGLQPRGGLTRRGSWQHRARPQLSGHPFGWLNPYSYTIWKTTSMQLNHERLDVYQVSLDFAAWAYELAKPLKSIDRHSRDQLLRASQSITLNVAEGCGKLPSAERRRFLQFAGGSARECGAILDILVRCRVITQADGKQGKELLVRIVAMLTRMMDPANHVRESAAVYGYEYVYEYGEDGKAQHLSGLRCQEDEKVGSRGRGPGA